MILDARKDVEIQYLLLNILTNTLAKQSAIYLGLSVRFPSGLLVGPMVGRFVFIYLMHEWNNLGLEFNWSSNLRA